jgi:hypothetical protein
MTKPLRWRILTLQAALVILFAFCTGFMFWASGYVQSTVRNELSAQSITFPKANDPGVTAKALTPCGGLAKGTACSVPTSHAIGVANSNAMKKYAGQTLTNGNQAQAYADSYIKVHLSDMGMTYAQASYQALTHPKNAQMEALANTIFKGDTLRSMLLNAYGWWTIGSYTATAAVALLLATLATFGAFLFELLLLVRGTATQKLTRSVGQPQMQPTV